MQLPLNSVKSTAAIHQPHWFRMIPAPAPVLTEICGCAARLRPAWPTEKHTTFFHQYHPTRHARSTTEPTKLSSLASASLAFCESRFIGNNDILLMTAFPICHYRMDIFFFYQSFAMRNLFSEACFWYKLIHIRGLNCSQLIISQWCA